MKIKHYLISFCLAIATQALLAQIPGVQWSKVTCPPKTYNGVSQTLAQSGEDWWYAHKNTYNSSNIQTGYVMVGYTSLVTTTATSVAAQTMYNEGSDSPCNGMITTTGYTFPTPAADCSDRDYGGEQRSPERGNVGLADLNGNMIWCHPRTNFDMQEVIQDPTNRNIIYVVGNHSGSKPFNAGYATFLPYNPTAAAGPYPAHTTDYFSMVQLGNPSGFPAGVAHAYVAKIDISVTGGLVIWEALYGNKNYGSTTATRLAAYTDASNGYDIIMNSAGNLVVCGVATSWPFLMILDPNNGNVMQKNALIGNSLNPDFQLPSSGLAHAITEMSPGIYAYSGIYNYPSASYDSNNAFVHCVNSYLTPVSSSVWATNPIMIPGSLVVSPNTYYNSNVWDVEYNATSNQILVPVIRDCDYCPYAGNEHGYGYIYRYNGTNGTLVPPVAGGPNPSAMGEIRAFDLRIGVTPTSDGGFIAVSSTRASTAYHNTPTAAELGPLAGCSGFTSPTTFNAWWDTDALVVKYSGTGATQWTKTFDVAPNRTRQPFPGDTKLQECVYKITQAQDGGYVISGNSSSDFDDNYLVKLYSECNGKQVYTTGPGNVININSNTTWSSSMQIMGQVVVAAGSILTITGSTTKIRFADSQATGILTNITVMPGARVNIVNGAELTSIDNAVCPGSMWDGITILGNSTAYQNYSGGFAVSQGLVSMGTGAIISNAHNAMTTGSTNSNGTFNWGTTGGVISAGNCSFINNERDIQFMYYSLGNRSVFTNCQFLTTGKLNNGLNPTGHISMYETQGVKINGCKFSYSGGTAYSDAFRGYGIYSIDAQYNVSSCLNPPLCSSTQTSIFENLTVGIEADNTKPIRVVNVDHATFTNNYNFGIRLSTMSSPNIYYTTMTTDPNLNISSGIYLDNCQNYLVSNNTITGSTNLGVGIYATKSGPGHHQIYKNTMTDLFVGVIPQYDNSGLTNYSDGLVINCDNFIGTTNNLYDIAELGYYGNGVGTTIAYNQGYITSPPPIDPQKLTRNQYGAPCGNDNKWFIQTASYGKIVKEASFNTTSTQPNYPTSNCSDPLVNVSIATSLAYNNAYCPVSPYTAYCPCGACCRLASINHVLDSMERVYHTNSTYYNSTVDKGSTSRLLGFVNTLSTVKDTLVAVSPYLSDTVMSAYFGKSTTTAANVIAVHQLNAPVTANVWNVILSRHFGTTDQNTLNSHQAGAFISTRQTLDLQLSRSQAQVQSVSASKLNYFLTDTMAASQDSAIALLNINSGGLPNAQLQRINAYSTKGNYTRAFALTDSLSLISTYTQLMVLQKIFLQLDTSASKALTLLKIPSMYATVQLYATDSTKAGSAMARSMLKFVSGTSIYSPRFLPGGGGFRLASTQTVTPTNNITAKSDEERNFRVYPNPSDGNFYLLYTDENQDAIVYTMHDIMGKEIRKGNLVRGIVLQLESNDLKAGIYFINVSNSSGSVSQQKIVIAK